MKIYQFKENYMQVFTYLIACEESKQAVVIDPAGDIEEVYEFALKNNYKIEYILNTHHHYDHTCRNRKLKKLTKAKLAIHKQDKKQLRKIFSIKKIKNFLKLKYFVSPKPEILLEDKQEIKLGNIVIKVIHTPGHTWGSVCFKIENNLFTGDTLFIGKTGRVNFPDSNRVQMGISLRNLLLNTSAETIIWPGHDYGPTKSSTVKWECENNTDAVLYGFNK